ncbi:hypothetical protein F442_14157 [Phytophthora nicotianae P10297]|uniref:DDE-1 domain-containing protein n=1 Tax=Phytophthora nicotianae P10297 TaxID=1317064 RepID=W2YTU7_PHYNI|nr:hypothetical protein F442_14157 [Phytophthora nicotianae P10297]
MHEKILFLWDDFSGHWTEEVTQYAVSINVVRLKVPPRYTYGVAKDKVIQLQEKLPRMAFEMVAPKRHEITAWIAESWSELSVDTIVSGFAKNELLTDTRSPVVAKDHDKPQDISDVLNQLADLGVADETVGSGDELVSSDSSDNE